MAWTKDADSDAPRIIYTPGDGDAAESVKHVVYDPNAAADSRYIIVASGVHAVDQAVSSFEAAIGL